MDKKSEFVIEFRAEELDISFNDLAEALTSGMSDAIESLAHGAYAKAIAEAQTKLHETRQDYIKGLQLTKIAEDMYLLSLEGEWPNALEKGFPGFDMKPKMLASKKIVEAGPRTGKPWVQQAKDGHKFAYVPLEKKPFTKAPEGRDMASAMRSLKAENAEGVLQSITKAFRDVNGNLLDSGSGINSRPVARVRDVSGLTDAMGKQLSGLVKYQKVHTSDSGKQTVQSIYHTYRVISENSSGWNHPGYSGVHIFDEIEKWVSEELDNVIRKFAG